MYSKKNLKEFYDRLPGDTYIKGIKSWFIPRKYFHTSRLKKTVEKIQLSNQLILDVGCGSGIISSECINRGHRVVGFDLGRNFVKTCNQMFKTPKSFFIPGDAESIPFADNTFDVVICTEVIEHLLDPQKTISEFYRVLKPNGTLLLSTPKKSFFWKHMFKVWEAFRRKQLEAYHTSFYIHEMGELLIKNKFQIAKTENIFFNFSTLFTTRAFKDKKLSCDSISIIVPAYNEEKRIGNSLERLSSFFKNLETEHEIIVVDDGSSDKTAAVVKRWSGKYPAIKLHTIQHGGKGVALKKGFDLAKNDVIVFMDADCSSDPMEIPRFLLYLKNFDVVIGSRSFKRSILLLPPPFRRIVVGEVFNFIVSIIFQLGIYDTLCGFKIFRKKVIKDILPHLKIDSWETDIEILAKSKRMGYKIKEIPAVWTYKSGSKINVVKDSMKISIGLLKLFFILCS